MQIKDYIITTVLVCTDLLNSIYKISVVSKPFSSKCKGV